MNYRHLVCTAALSWLAAIPVLSAQSLFGDNPWLSLPDRSYVSESGVAFGEHLKQLSPADREREILNQALSGNIPYFLRELRPVTIQLGETSLIRQLTFWTSSDYFAIGSDQNYLRIPMNLHSAKALAKQLNCILPTPKMVDLIYQHARHQLKPKPMKPGKEMTTVAYFQRHNATISQQLDRRDFLAGDLVAGHKKDIVISRKLDRKPSAIAIYGWHRSPDKVIQPLSTVHGASYADYSHGVRLVHRSVEIVTHNGEIQRLTIDEILNHPEYSYILSDEGPMRRQLKDLQPIRQPVPGRI